MNINEGAWANKNSIKTFAVVFQRNLILAAAFQIIPGNWIELRLGEWGEIKHIGAVCDSRVGLFGLWSFLRFEVTWRAEHRGQL